MRSTLVFLLLAAAAGAEPIDPPEPAGVPLVPVGEVSITAARAERDVLEVPGHVTIIDREQIDRSPAATLPGLLRREAGLDLVASTTNPAGFQVESRGFSNGAGNGSSLLVQIDGRRVNEADTANADWALLSLDEIEAIEIVRGPASALYGDNAMGGVIDIRTRPVEGPPRGTLRGHGGSYDTGGGSLKAAASQGPVTAGLFVEGMTTGAYRSGADFERQNVKASLEGRIGDRILLGAGGGRYYDERGFPGALDAMELATLGRRAQEPGSEGTGSRVESRFVDAWFESLLTDDLELRIRPQHAWRDDRATLVFDSGMGRNSDSRAKSSTGVDTQLRLDRPLLGRASRLMLGFDFLRDDTDRTDRFAGSFVSEEASSSLKKVYAVYIQEELAITESLLLSAGFRYDRADYELSKVDLLNPADAAADQPSFDLYSPKAALTWRFAPAGSAYFSYGRGFRLPSFDEAAPTLTGGPPQIPDLSPQISDSFELGTKWLGERVQASLALYWMEVDDEIVFNAAINCFPPFGCFGQNDNFDEVRHRGVELALGVRLLAWLSAYANYTFDDVVITESDDPVTEDSRMPMVPRHRGNVGLVASGPYGLEMTAEGRFVDDRIPANDFSREAQELDGYAALDLLFAWRPELSEHVRGALSFALRNVTGEKYEDLAVRSATDPSRVAFYPAPGRNWEVRLMFTVSR